MEAKVGLVQVAYDKILDRILTFSLKPGDIVSDYQLSQELGMSRTPVREAIRRLMYDSLVVQGPSKAVVSEITVEDIQEITELRTALEQEAIEIIVTRNPMSAKQVNELRALNAGLAKAIAERDYRRNFEIEDLFHWAIIEGSRNRMLAEAYRRHHLLIVRARWLSLFFPDYERTLEEHRSIIDAIEKRDLPSAITALKTHMSSSNKHFSLVFTDPAVREAARFVASIKLDC